MCPAMKILTLCSRLTFEMSCPDAAQPAGPHLAREQLFPPMCFTPAEPGCSLQLGNLKHNRRGCLRGAEMLVREEGECNIWCGHILSGQPSQMFVTFGIAVLPKKQNRRVVVLAISVGTSCLPDSLSLLSWQVPAGFLLSFILRSCFIKANTARGPGAQRLTKIRPDLKSCLQIVFGPGGIWCTKGLKSEFASPKCSYVHVIVCKVLWGCCCGPVRMKKQCMGRSKSPCQIDFDTEEQPTLSDGLTKEGQAPKHWCWYNPTMLTWGCDLVQESGRFTVESGFPAETANGQDVKSHLS